MKSTGRDFSHGVFTVRFGTDGSFLSFYLSGKEEVACYQHIVKDVDVKWILPDCSGKATLEGIRLTPEMVQLATVSPIEWGKISAIRLID